MRLSELIPIILCAASFVLAFLCLFAGSSKSFMEEYAILTLNTSRIGQELFITSASSDNPIVSFVDNVTNSIESAIQDAVGSIAQELGLHDFYSVHLMDYCEGYYTPGPVPNATLQKSDINQNVTACSNRTSMYSFDPKEILQDELDNSGHGNIDLVNDLQWPDSVQKGIKTLKTAAKATFVLYCIAIGFIGVALILAIISIVFDGRLSTFINVVMDCLAFLVIGIASAMSTAIAVKATDIINKYGGEIGISANQGNKFLIITWVSTGLMLLASIAWCIDCIVGRRRRNVPKYG